MGYFVKSWVVEVSLNGKRWTELNRQTDDEHFAKRWRTASFRVSAPVECLFIGLTLTDETHWPDAILRLSTVEFVGALSEYSVTSDLATWAHNFPFGAK
jgi:hypothetical protein